MDNSNAVLYDDHNSAITYTGPSSNTGSGTSGWYRDYGSIYLGAGVHRTNKIGDRMIFRFNGSAIRFIGAQGWDHGKMRFALTPSASSSAERQETEINAFCCGRRGGVPQVNQFEATGLGGGEHELVVENLERGVYGSVMEVDAI